MPRKVRTPLEKRAKRAEESGSSAAAGWLGEPFVASAMARLRPDFYPIVQLLGLDERDDVTEALATVLGFTTVHPGGSESTNPFATWPEERLAFARFVAGGIRKVVASLTADAQAAGVRLEAVSDDPSFEDGLGFSADHFYLLLLLASDIPLAGRPGAEIAAELPPLPTVHWERTGDILRASDHATEQDMRDVFALRAAWRRTRGEGHIRKPYAAGGLRSAGNEPSRDARRAALAQVLVVHPQVTAPQLRATWTAGPSTPGGQLRALLGLRPWDNPPGESTLRADLRELRR
jgi:hypothetical protein